MDGAWGHGGEHAILTGERVEHRLIVHQAGDDQVGG
jgi:hypothetical protein